jgi:hypothetical protein
MPQLTRTRRIWYRYLYVILAVHLSADPVDDEDPSSLRADVSTDGICYLRAIRSLNDGTYLVRVAKSPELLAQAGYTVLLTEEQFATALPWDCRLQDKGPAHLSALLCAYQASPRHALQEAGTCSERSGAPELPQHPDSSAKELSVSIRLFERLRQAVVRVCARRWPFRRQLVHLSTVYRGRQQIGRSVQIDLPVSLTA